VESTKGLKLRYPLHSKLCIQSPHKKNTCSSINEGCIWTSPYLNHHLFPIQYVEYLSSLWMSFKGQNHWQSVEKIGQFGR